MARYVITLESEPGDKWAGRRLAKWLKAALRGYRLRCIDAKEIKDDHMQPVNETALAKLKAGMKAAQALPCLLCGSPNAAVGGIWQLDAKTAKLTGAPPGKLRHMVYSLCLACADKPHLAQRVEDVVLRAHAGPPERN